MNLRRHSRKVPKLNTASTADISFMLLIFFLVTTSMYVDKGIVRQLPPADKQKDQKDVLIEKENILALKLDAEGTLMINDTVCEMDKLQERLLSHMQSRLDKHVISIDSDPACKYDAYYRMQTEIGEAYKKMRTILPKFPQRIAENFHETEEGGLGL